MGDSSTLGKLKSISQNSLAELGLVYGNPRGLFFSDPWGLVPRNDIIPNLMAMKLKRTLVYPRFDRMLKL